MTDIATLGLEVRSDGVVVATDRLRRFDGQAKRTDGAARLLTTTMNRLAAIAGTAVIAAVGTNAVRAFAAYEQGLKNVGAVSGATAEELGRLDAAALRAAASTRFNPGQTTSALYSLASAGLAANEQIATLPNVLNLAEAAQADLGQTTELLTSTLAQFNLSAEASGRVADVFTASIGASALNVNRLQVAFRNAGPTASALNQSLEGTTAALGVLTTAFGNGERAGTGLRAVLNELPAQAESLGVNLYDANGAMRPFVEILSDLEDNGLTAATAVRMFGAEAGPALAAFLTKGSEGLAEMEGRLLSTGQAADVAADQLDTLQGDIDNLASAIDVAMVEIGRSQSGFVRPAIQTVTNLIRLWSGYGDTLGDALEPTQRIASAIERVGVYAATAAAGFVTYRGAVFLASLATKGLSGALVVLRGALIRTGIGALIIGAGELVYQFTQLVDKTGSVGGAFQEAGRIGLDVFDRMQTAAYALQLVFQGVASSLEASMVRAFAGIKESITGMTDHALAERARALDGYAAGLFGRASDDFAHSLRPDEGEPFSASDRVRGNGGSGGAGDPVVPPDLPTLPPVLTEIADATAAANDNFASMNALLSEGDAIFNATRTSFENLGYEIAYLTDLRDRDVIGWDTWSRAVSSSIAGTAANALGSLASLSSGLSQAFEDNKALSIATAVLKGAESIASSFAAGAQIGGPPVGLAYAAVAAITAAANVAAVAATSTSSTSISGGSRGGGSGGGRPANNNTPPPANNNRPDRVEPVQRQAVTINLQGNHFRFTRDELREFVEQVSEAHGDGMENPFVTVKFS